MSFPTGWFSFLVLAISTIAATSNANGQTETPQPLSIGANLPEFALNDFRGKAWKSTDFDNDRPLVVIFFGLECPLMKLYAPRILEIEPAVFWQRCPIRRHQFEPAGFRDRDASFCPSHEDKVSGC